MSLAHPSLSPNHPAQPLAGDVAVPGDKATGSHALLLAALAVGESRISALPEHGDVLHMASALRALGAEVIREAPGAWRVAGRGIGGLREPEGVLDMGNSGTAARLICGALASHDLFATVTGSASLRRRSMGWMTDMLQGCGARFHCPADAWLPLAVQGARNAVPVERRLSAKTAPAKSALLLAGLNAPGWTRVTEAVPTCDRAARLLRHFGASVTVEPCGGHATGVMGQPELRATDLTVPGDPSLAAIPLVAALVVPGSAVTVRGVPMDPRRVGLFAALRKMGAHLEVARERLDCGEPVADITATHTGLHGADLAAAQAGSMAGDSSILAVAAACASGPTRMEGHAALQADNSLLSATLAMLRRSGVRVEDAEDGVLVHGNGTVRAGGVRIEAGAAPHVTLCGLVLNLAAATPARVDEPAEIEDNYPGILALLRQIGAPLL